MIVTRTIESKAFKNEFPKDRLLEFAKGMNRVKQLTQLTLEYLYTQNMIGKDQLYERFICQVEKMIMTGETKVNVPTRESKRGKAVL